jgi:hypothetical protein
MHLWGSDALRETSGNNSEVVDERIGDCASIQNLRPASRLAERDSGKSDQGEKPKRFVPLRPPYRGRCAAGVPVGGRVVAIPQL